RWNAVVRAIRDRLPTLGRLRALYLNQRFEPSPLAWLDDPDLAGAGIILHTGVHSFDLVRWLTGREVARVWCRAARAVTPRPEALRAFVRLVLDGEAPPVVIEDGAGAVLIAEACLRSVACGSAVAVEALPPG